MRYIEYIETINLRPKQGTTQMDFIIELARNNPATMFVVCVVITALWATWAKDQF